MIEIDCANIVKNTGDKSEVEIYFGASLVRFVFRDFVRICQYIDCRLVDTDCFFNSSILFTLKCKRVTPPNNILKNES